MKRFKAFLQVLVLSLWLRVKEIRIMAELFYLPTNMPRRKYSTHCPYCGTKRKHILDRRLVKVASHAWLRMLASFWSCENRECDFYKQTDLIFFPEVKKLTPIIEKLSREASNDKRHGDTLPKVTVHQLKR
jgi:hypothetical protein